MRNLLKFFSFTFSIFLYTLSAHAGWKDDCFAGDEDCVNPPSEGEWHRLEYVGKQQRSNFYGPGWGAHLMYFPAFNMVNATENLPTDHANSVESTPQFKDLKHASEVQTPSDWAARTFTLDDSLSAVVDALLNGNAESVGTATAGGYSSWPLFTLPTGQTGRSGSTYDPYSKDNSSNIINKLVVNTNQLKAFCLNVITDNTNGKFNPNLRINAQSDVLDVEVPAGDLVFDGVPDVYTFKYRGFEAGDRVKLKIKASNAMTKGGGFGGVMVSHITTCSTASCGLENECGGDDGNGQPCPCTKNEVHADLIPNSLPESQGGQAYYLRGIYTRQVLTVNTSNSFVDMRPRVNAPNQQWVFVGGCGSNTKCKGYFVNKETKGCLRRQDNVNGKWAYSGSCTGDKHKWVIKVNGYDEVTGDQDFPQSGGIYKYTIRHEPSNNNFLVAKRTLKEAIDAGEERRVFVGSRNNPNKPWEHWIFEAVQPGE